MTTTASDLNTQKKQAEEQMRLAEKLIVEQKDMLRKNIAQIDKSISELQSQRSRAQSDLSKLA